MWCPLRDITYFIMLRLSFSGLSNWQVLSAEITTPLIPFDKALRQDIPEHQVVATQAKKGGKFLQDVGPQPGQFPEGHGDAQVTKKKKRTTPILYSRNHYCDYWARPCMHAYVTGKLCARTSYYTYETFENYCMMEYVNCRENYELWQVVHMGACFNIPRVSDFVHYAYHDDAFLDDYYLIEDKFNI